MIDIYARKGAADRPLGTVQVENLTTEAEAKLYGEYEINKQWIFIDQVGVNQEELKIANPFDFVNANSAKRGWEGKKLFVSSVNIVINDNNICTTTAECEYYTKFEDC